MPPNFYGFAQPATSRGSSISTPSAPSRKAARLRAFAVRFSGSFWRWANRLTVTPAMRLAKAYPSTKDGQILVPIALRADGRSNRVFRENRPFPQA
jgi:hypothetical protein